MRKGELKPIDVSKYTVTESGNVIKSEELKSERIEALREKLRTELNKWWKKTFDVKREDDVCQVIRTKEAEDLCFDIALPREMQIDILSQHILELQADKGRLTDRVRELELQIEKMKSQYDYAFNQLCESREIVCLMLSQYKNKKEIDYSTRERGEKLLKQGVYKYD